MTDASLALVASASDLATFDDCEARFFHGTRSYPEVLATDRLAADVSASIHGALMEYHRQAEALLRRGAGLPDPPAHLRRLVDKHLARNRLNPRAPAVIERLARFAAGLDAAAAQIVADVPAWATDPGCPSLRLVWVEQRLDHGPGVDAVELQPGYLVRTRPDVIGLRLVDERYHRALVRDFKARKEPVDPAGDVGILIRAIWVLRELQRPRCRWFLAGRRLDLDPTGVDLEVVNLGFAAGPEFVRRAGLTAAELLDHRDRFVEALERMEAVRRATSADEVLASPNGLCYQWCPFLERCEPGKNHVRKYVGEDELAARLGVVAAG